MKKTIIAIALFLTLPFSAGAAGYGGVLTCTPSTQSNPTCRGADDAAKRLYDLEMEMDQLNTKLQNLANMQPAPAQTVVQTKETVVRDPDNTKVDALAVRVATTETAVSNLNSRVSNLEKRVIDLLNTTIGYLKQILKIK